MNNNHIWGGMLGGGRALAVQGAVSIGLLVRLLLASLWGKLDQIVNPEKRKL